MGEEQRQILQMVADGKISAEDGARLLEALQKGERKREADSPAGRARQKKRIMKERISRGEVAGLSGIRDIGRMIRSAISSNMDELRHIDIDDMDETDEVMFGRETALEDALDIPKDTRLVIRQGRKQNKSGNLNLTGIPGSSLKLIGEDAENVHYSIADGTVMVRWDQGDLELGVPETVESLSVSLLGGNVVMSGIDSTTLVKTKGGNVSCFEASGGFSIKTMGGNLELELSEDWNMDSKAVTMGGNVSLSIPEGTSGLISARTVGGEIFVQDEIDIDDESGLPGVSRLNIDLSEGEDAPEISLRSVGGNISIAYAGQEEQESEKKRKKGKKKEK